MKTYRSDISFFSRQSILWGMFIVLMVACGALVSILSYIEMSERTRGLIIALFQGTLAFIFPAFIYARFVSKAPLKILGVTKRITLPNILGIIILFFVGYAALNQIIYWNESMRLPESLSSLEKMFRNMEDAAQAQTQILLSTTSWGGLISGIVIIGLFTGFAEEIFFRGAFQNSMVESGINPHVAIWTAAFVFSALHFQIYGFVPRLLLGAFFGYLFFWTDSIWASASAHALNNSIAVVFAWLGNRNIIQWDPENAGVVETGIPFTAIISFSLLCLIIGCFKNYFFRNRL